MNKLVLIFLYFACNAMAAIPIEQAGTVKKNHYLKEGVFVGGFDQGEVRLLDVRHSYDTHLKMERLVFDTTPIAKVKKNGENINRPGFFHVAIRSGESGSKLVLDLSHCTQPQVTASQVMKLFSRSRFFSSAQFAQDSETKSLTIELLTKSPAEFEVFELASESKPGRIVIDAKGL
jgi:hypothetical protein